MIGGVHCGETRKKKDFEEYIHKSDQIIHNRR